MGFFEHKHPPSLVGVCEAGVTENTELPSKYSRMKLPNMSVMQANPLLGQVEPSLLQARASYPTAPTADRGFWQMQSQPLLLR